MPLEPQAALETAVVQAIRLLTYPDLNGNPAPYTHQNCNRSERGQPWPDAGKLFVAVWHDGSRQSRSREALYEVFGVKVTVTVAIVRPKDRLTAHRDRLEVLLNPIRALIHNGIAPGTQALANISAEACRFAGLDAGGASSNPSLRVGFREALMFQRYDEVQWQGPDWFNSHVDAPNPPFCGVSQTAHFGGVSRVQAISGVMS